MATRIGLKVKDEADVKGGLVMLMLALFYLLKTILTRGMI